MLFPRTLRERLHQAAVAKCFQPVWSPWIVGERYRVLTWRWENTYGISDGEYERRKKAASATMLLRGEVEDLVNIPRPWPPPWPSLKDPSDHPIGVTAKLAQAQYVVSDNIADFPPTNDPGQDIWEGIAYITADECLREIL